MIALLMICSAACAVLIRTHLPTRIWGEALCTWRQGWGRFACARSKQPPPALCRASPRLSSSHNLHPCQSTGRAIRYHRTIRQDSCVGGVVGVHVFGGILFIGYLSKFSVQMITHAKMKGYPFQSCSSRSSVKKCPVVNHRIGMSRMSTSSPHC